MFLQRAIVTLTLGPLALWLIYLGGLFYFIPIALVLLLATHEYTHIIQKLGWTTSFALLSPLVALQWAAGQWSDGVWSQLAFVLAVFVVMTYGIWRYEYKQSEKALAEWLGMLGGVVILGWLGSHFFRLRAMPNMAWQWTMLAMLATWIADSGAYLVGKFLAGRVLGRHKMSPRTSPNKTYEGLFGGAVLGTVFTVLIGNYLGLTTGLVLVLGLSVSLLSPLGDLGMSLLKRQAGVKDSGTLFPGHGGALDRIDSLMWSVTMAYYLVMFFA